ncbi:DNA methyltransferase [Bacillus phage Bcp1]|uniref:C-5 cytosine-specific DNA methylase II n=1 Tax=Bacillus phage Bcp1 TaxID=584892 RepID=X2JIV2_9CAUD|nr:DNA methyltransferase [Bacillus phage Bcp1]AHN66609.1 C-5 cytosine-specific DNA methylase II [Bacillus phage Bcp1]AXQ67800.1 DNA cytosine methyltransferase [Bacillus phage Kioshi]
MTKLKLVSLFSGIGAFEKALEILGVDYELVAFSEIDTYAIQSYCAIHNIFSTKNLGDIKKVDYSSVPDFDLMTYGFPCQDISSGGREAGLAEGSNTRSSTLWDAMNLANTKKPKYMIAENVKNLLSPKFKNDFDKWMKRLDQMGYNTYYSVINAKDFVPQNRERVFVVSIRKDVDKGDFTFPTDYVSLTRLHNIMETDILTKYYLRDEIQQRLDFDADGWVSPENTNEILRIGQVSSKKSQAGTVYHSDGIFPTVCAGTHGYAMGYVFETSTKLARRITPLEAWKLMGFSEEDYQKVRDIMSDTQLYKQAGNSIVVDVAVALLRQLF